LVSLEKAVFPMKFKTVHGDLLSQKVDVIVNSWNRNLIPWWLLIPQGVSGAIKRHAGYRPFLELPIFKTIPLGGAVITSAGRLPYKAIIHVAGINLLWRATEFSIRESVKNSVRIAEEHHFKSLAMPIIGAGSSGFESEKACKLIENELESLRSLVEVTIVIYP
jgi:O-acetyl-ADP-ribose deacetylase (regulator of RNase III)